MAGGGPSGAAPEQAPLLHDFRAAQGASAGLLPPGLVGGGGDRPGPGGQLAEAAGQPRGTAHTGRVCVDDSVYTDWKLKSCGEIVWGKQFIELRL